MDLVDLIRNIYMFPFFLKRRRLVETADMRRLVETGEIYGVNWDRVLKKNHRLGRVRFIHGLESTRTEK